MRDVFIVDAVRTPIGRYGGALSGVRPDDLAAQVIKALIARQQVDPTGLDDVILGCANQAGEDNRNVARMSVLLAGLPVTVPGVTLNRLCGSGMQALVSGAHAIAAGEADLLIVGGVESMSRAPLVMAKAREGFPRGDMTLHDTTLGWRFTHPDLQAHGYTAAMGETAEKVAHLRGITRDEQDEFALRSQQNCAAAEASGRFTAERIPVESAAQPGAQPVRSPPFTVDENPRPHTTRAALAGLRPAFRPNGGTVTAGNASGINDGAAGLLIASQVGCARLGAARPLARFVASAVAGVEPSLMGLGPIPAARHALKRAGATSARVGLAEINEAFAAQAIPCIRDLELDPEVVNVNGGAIALGHPLGCSGARIVVTLVHELSRRRALAHAGPGLALAAMCIGVGQGIAVVIEGADAAGEPS